MPMEGMDSARVKRPAAARKAEICMVVSAGKRTEKVYGDRFRFSRDTFYKES